METVTIPPERCGFPGYALGGYTAGLMATAAGEPLEVTLRQPVRTGVALQIDVDDGTVQLRDGEEILAEGTRQAPSVDVAHRPSLEDAAESTSRYPGPDEHPQPACFCCSPARDPGDGLRVHTTPVDGHPDSLVQGRWAPHERFANGDGVLPGALVWAALDCPAIWSVWHRTGEDTMTGRLSTRVERPVLAGRPYVVIGWMTGSEGRRRFAAAAVLDENGDVAARGTQTCVVVDAGRLPV